MDAHNADYTGCPHAPGRSRPVRSRGQGLKEIKEDYIRMAFVASKRHLSLCWLTGFIALEVCKIQKCRHWSRFDPEVHKGNGMWLYPESLSSALFCLLCPQARLFFFFFMVARRLPPFYFPSWVKSENLFLPSWKISELHSKLQ